jgi:signal transduction histidine kinase
MIQRFRRIEQGICMALPPRSLGLGAAENVALAITLAITFALTVGAMVFVLEGFQILLAVLFLLLFKLAIDSRLDALLDTRSLEVREPLTLQYGALDEFSFEIESKAIETERRRVAKELHDEILPSLVRLIRSIHSQRQEHHTEELLEELHNTVASFRDLLGELHPVDLEEIGLVAALSNLCSRYARLTGHFIVFLERVEESPLPEFQQLCLYRAMQGALRMFTSSENDILVVSYDHQGNKSTIVARCVDKRFSSARWLSNEKRDFKAFEAWCTIAGATVEIGTRQEYGFPRDLVISIQETPTEALDRNGNEPLPRDPSPRDPSRDPSPRDNSLFEHLAIEAERKRISQEIDMLILPHLSRVIQIADQSNDDSLAMEVRERMQVIATGVGGIMSELHRRMLAEAGLVSSIKTLVDRFRRASSITTSLVTRLLSDQSLDIPLESQFAVYRVTQEALNNVEKHSGASHARVSIKKTGDGLRVCVEDNGRGFHYSGDYRSRGLKNIRERASAIGARIKWEKATSFESGTLVTISLDLPES